MVYCSECEHFEYTEDGYLCCRIRDSMRIGFDMDSLNKSCPKIKIMKDGVFVFKKE